MPSQKLLDLQTELVAAKGYLDPRIAGLENYMKLGGSELTLTGDSLLAIQQAHERRIRRSQLIQQALSALSTLDADSYPDVSPIRVPQVILDDLAEEQRELTQALSEFALDESATNLNLSASDPTPKE